MGQLGLVYYMFLVGLEMDLTMLKHIEKKAMWNAAFGIVFPLGMGICSYFLLTFLKGMDSVGMGGAVWAITLTVTSFGPGSSPIRHEAPTHRHREISPIFGPSFGPSSLDTSCSFNNNGQPPFLFLERFCDHLVRVVVLVCYSTVSCMGHSPQQLVQWRNGLRVVDLLYSRRSCDIRINN